jgi:gliding motility-associated-like protein
LNKFVFFTFLVFFSRLFASHIVGGDIYYDYLGNNNYRIHVVIFRDCNSTGAGFDDPLQVGIYNSSNNLVQSVSINFPGSQILPIIFDNPCIDPPTNICTERAIYIATVNLPPIVGGYTIAYQRCCRGPNVTNLVAPEDTGLTLVTRIPGSETNAFANSSARFDNYPPLVICNNDDLVFDHTATDPDGDQLVYEFAAPFAGATDINPAPPPSGYNPPFFPVIFQTNFSVLNPLGPGATISINPSTGLLVADPELLGFFVVGIKVKEFRNGVLINEMIRDFIFKVINCEIELAATIVPQDQMTNLTSFCEGLSITFQNNSFGGTNYKWDFGVPGITTDVSTQFAPTYTYPEAGVYTVSLVVNPGMPCSDTSFQTFNIFEKINLNFSVIDSMCITNNNHEFIGSYDGPANPTFSWDFGPHANIQTASSLSVQNIVFDTVGFIDISLTVSTGICEETVTDKIFIFNEPIINFGIDPELKCAPYMANFIDSCISNASLIYLWDFGDGSTSSDRFPKHLYDSPGIYDVSLSIQTTEGCPAILTLSKPGLINVFASPISLFDVTPDKATVFSPYFDLLNMAATNLQMYYIVDTFDYIYEPNPRISFVESGNHLIQQVVINQFGCADTSHHVVKIIPFTTVYIPNTFTPDGNKFNNEFAPQILDASYYEIQIYNRWGEQIFYSLDPKVFWDGTYKNEPAPDGTYIYKIIYQEYDGANNIEINGHINLIR